MRPQDCTIEKCGHDFLLLGCMQSPTASELESKALLYQRYVHKTLGSLDEVRRHRLGV